MKPLDEFIRSNLDSLNSDEPLDGHFDRFTERLSQIEKSRISKPWIFLLKVASVLIIGFAVTYVAIHEFTILKNNTAGSFSGSATPELNEAIQYYSAQLDINYNKIQKLRFNNDQNEKKQVLEELSEMDKQVQSMKKDLRQNPDDERVVHAIINFYQVKIEMTDMIIARTQQATQSIL